VKADLILARGVIRTLGGAGLKAQTHIAIAGGRVAAVGGAELAGLKGPRTRVVDLKGSAVLPGFNDAHAHVVYYGLTRFGADLGGARSVQEIVSRLRTHGRRLKKGEWQQGMGYRVDELAELRAPHRTELDQATGARPCYIDERGGHSRSPIQQPSRRQVSWGRDPTPRAGALFATATASPTACFSKPR